MPYIAIREYLNAHPDLKVKLLTSTRALEINNKGLVAEGPEGNCVIEADTVVFTADRRPLREQAQELVAAAPEFFTIGDCVMPRNI